jgi:glycerol-3-phosphate acyltransferase PlsY
VNWLWIVVGYFFGSTPTGFLVVRLLRGEDIRRHGSGNIGATNVGRVMGRPWAVAVAIFDMAKGGLAVILARAFGVADPLLLAFVGVAGVCGHNFPLWLRFKGGKGVATSFGVLFFLNPPSALIGGALWYVIMRLSRYVSLASMLSLASVPLLLFLFKAPGAYVGAAVFLALLTVVRHRANIARLLAGTESKVGKG